MTLQRRIIVVLLILAAMICGLLYLVGISAENPVDKRRAFAIARMVTGLMLIWVWLGGGLMLRFRYVLKARVQAIPLENRLKFVLFATLLACLEEAVTVSMTNLAPLFGSRVGEAYITASSNYLDVIAFHSVVVFIPFFIVIALLLSRYRFSPFALFISFGMVGTCAEAIFAASPTALVMFPLWCFVYGLMVWLPAFCLGDCIAKRPTAPIPGLLAHLMLAPAILGLALPLIAPVVWVIAVVLEHPAIDFAPMDARPSGTN